MNKITLFNIKTNISLFGFLFFFLASFGQQNSDFVRQIYVPTQPACIYYEHEYEGKSSVGIPEEIMNKMAGGGTPCATIIVNYNGFTPEAQAAFQYAVDIWEMFIDSPVPINISATFSNLGPGVLGQAGPVNFQTTAAPEAQPNTFYPKALVEKLEGEDNSPFGGSNDINAQFSSAANWYFGLDANPPSGQFDFVSVVLHELGHGLGFTGFGSVDTLSGVGEIRASTPPTPSIYDTFIENGTSDAILSFADPSVDLGDQLTGNDLYCNGPIAIGQNGNISPRIFAPTSWNQGSSYSHWNESTFLAGDINSLMTPQIGPGEANHNPGPITLGFFEDMGWSICGGSLTVEEFDLASVELSPNPFSAEISVRLSNGLSDDYSIDVIDINGRLVLTKEMTAINGQINIDDLGSLTNALYFIKITNENSGASVTKKIIKN